MNYTDNMNEESQEYIKKFVAQRVNELMIENQITNRKALSHLIGYNEHFISDLLNKKRNPYIVTVYDLCDFFGITLEDFFRVDYSKDKSVASVMKLLTDNYKPEELSLLYDILSHVDKGSIITLLSSYRTYFDSKIEDKNEKI
ncbi:helix-turn-helix transcriptional regulator [Christensenella intestinihominis]|uniref:helix-turn-helix transcriptional regulator n=2 Tax=Christensenella intestinihominis TaxID=1851429 RepID=UPI0011CAFC11|nr:helix-turn-helix transcriptional regulator [Christensenella intestinihominis]